MNPYILVGIGGAIGAILRFAISETMDTHWGTLTVNAVGSLLLGICMAALASEMISKEMAILLGSGILGAFTTMSTFSVETIELWRDTPSTAITYVAITMVLCPILALIGWKAIEISS